jgi:hypothetical protein
MIVKRQPQPMGGFTDPVSVHWTIFLSYQHLVWQVGYFMTPLFSVTHSFSVSATSAMHSSADAIC